MNPHSAAIALVGRSVFRNCLAASLMRYRKPNSENGMPMISLNFLPKAFRFMLQDLAASCVETNRLFSNTKLNALAIFAGEYRYVLPVVAGAFQSSWRSNRISINFSSSQASLFRRLQRIVFLIFLAISSNVLSRRFGSCGRLDGGGSNDASHLIPCVGSS